MDGFLGIDVGSVSTNIVIIDNNGNVVWREYIRTNGQPIDAVKTGIRKLKRGIGDTHILGAGTTGSGRQLTGIMIGADVIKNEITAHGVATCAYYPDVSTIFEIGGQDSKIIIVKNGMVVDFAMNTVCAAGTGSFLDHQAERLQIPIEEFGDMALLSTQEVRIAGRCTVFAESDMISKQQFGFSKENIIRGLCDALVRNYLNNLGRGKDIKPPYAFQGGVAANKGIIAAFERELGDTVFVPENYDVMGAIGAALLSKKYIKKTGKETKFKGFEAVDLDFTPTTFCCDGCSNSCEVVKISIDGNIEAMWGDKCGKWSNSISTIAH